MPNPEFETMVATVMDSGATKDTTATYVAARRLLEAHINCSLSLVDRSGFLIPDFPEKLEDLISEVDESSPAIRAAFFMGVCAWRSLQHNMPSFDRSPALEHSFSQIFSERNYRLRRLSNKAESLTAAITLPLDGRFTHIDMNALRRDFWETIQAGTQEMVVITGLNGAGKTTIIEGLMGFLRACGLKTQSVKFPRAEGPLASVILPVLRGEQPIDERALQFLMIADAAATPVSGGEFIVYDRHPLIDTFAFGPSGTEVAFLAAREAFLPAALWTVVVDRHPANCQQRIEQREAPARIFERGLEAMARQQLRFMALTLLPGLIVVNNDLPSRDEERVLKASADRVIGALLQRRVIQRALVRQGLCRDVGADGAGRIIEKAIRAHPGGVLSI